MKNKIDFEILKRNIPFKIKENIQIISPNESDFKAMEDILFQLPISEQDFHKRYLWGSRNKKVNQMILFVAKVENVIKGYIGITINFDLPQAHFVTLCMGIDQGINDNDIKGRLLKLALNFSDVCKKVSCLELNVAVGNSADIEFFIKHGFEIKNYLVDSTKIQNSSIYKMIKISPLI